MTLKSHLLSRYLNLELHKPVLNEVEGIATFYLWNLSGQMVGYQQYRPEGSKKNNNEPKEGKYFTYRNKTTVGIWGVESLVAFNTPVLFLTEGVFDAARLTSRGVTAFASLTNDPSGGLRNFLHMFGRKVVSVCDGDRAGSKLAKSGHESFVVPDGDLGDASEELVTHLLQKYNCA